MTNSINIDEIKKFESMAEEWWDPLGKFKPLHKFNPIRLEYITKQIDLNFSKKNITLLDIGCGGGLMAEPLSKNGIKVTAIDPSNKNINIAKAHQKKSKTKVEYIHTTLEELDIKNKYDVIICLEVVEHVDNPSEFLLLMEKHLNKNGIIFIATINRTYKSLFCAKFAAEYILNWLPQGTHQYSKFLKPHEINNMLKEKLNLIAQKGMKYNLFKDCWNLTEDLSQNYIMTFKKSK